MKKKFKVLVAFSALMVCMSSCVFSLFPIYTKDTIAYLPELIGKWQIEGRSDQYVEFSSGIDFDATISVNPTDSISSSKPKVSSSFKVTFDDGEYVIVDGDTIREREKVQAYWDGQMDSMKVELEEDMVNAMVNLAEGLTEVGSALSNIDRSKSKKYSRSSKSYRMRLYDEGHIIDYEATLTLIGDDYFLDLYANEGQQTELNFESRVWFPVHTFMKLQLKDGQLLITEFDLQKMNKLFESNLVRIRHENVDGTILITAKTEEIRKFLDKYSDDESVFEKPQLYSRVLE